MTPSPCRRQGGTAETPSESKTAPYPADTGPCRDPNGEHPAAVCAARFGRCAYDPLEPEPEPWSGDAGFGLDGAGLEFDGAAGACGGFGAIWVVGAAGVTGRGAIGDVPACDGVDAGADGPDSGAVEAGRGGAGGGT